MFYLIYFDFSIKDSLIIILSEMFSLKITVVSDIYFDILSTTDVIYSHCIEKNNLKLMTIHSRRGSRKFFQGGSNLSKI